MFEYKALIPKARINLLTKDNGKNKKLLEELLKVKIEIRKDELTILSEDSYNGWICEKIIKAIGRGFNANEALSLLDENKVLEIVDISDFVKTKKSLTRVKGRVIGEGGRAKRHLEKITGSTISVYGKTISVICNINISLIVRKAVQMLLEGAKHSTAYRYIENNLKKVPEF